LLALGERSAAENREISAQSDYLLHELDQVLVPVHHLPVDPTDLIVLEYALLFPRCVCPDLIARRYGKIR